MIIQLLILLIILVGIPVLVGGIFEGVYTGSGRWLFRWVSGQVLLWAGFELLCVPMILTEQKLGLVIRGFLLFTAAAGLLAVWMDGKRRKGRQLSGKKDTACCPVREKVVTVLWCIAAVLLAVQLFLACILAYEEGDDAYYVSISTAAASSDRMYHQLPYTGMTTLLDVRHALAPFPIWISFLARISGMEAVTIAQVVLPVVLIVMCYGVYFMIGSRLFQKDSRKHALFMLLLECLVLFGGYSVYSAENFLLVRTAQGKAVLANIMIPFLFLLFFILLEKLQDEKPVGMGHWFLTAGVMAAGCLCSTQGTQLTGMLLGIIGICAVFLYRKWKILFPLAGCCLIPLGVIWLYFRF